MDANLKRATVIVEGTFKEGYGVYFEEYSVQIQQFLKKHPTTIVRRQLIIETLYGTNTPNLIMLIDFESIQVARNIFFEEEYKAIIPLRNKVFKVFKMYLAEFGNI